MLQRDRRGRDGERLIAQRSSTAGGASIVAPPRRISRAHAIVAGLSITETVSWGIVYYAFAVFIAPMRDALHASTAQLAGALSMALLISGVAGIAVGRLLDRTTPRLLMTTGSVAAAGLVFAWSRVETIGQLYAVWAGLGLAMAAILYEPAFAVVAKWFDDPAARRRAMTAMTLVAALASFIFLPLSQALIEHHGWRHALVVLAIVLGVVTVPIHALVLRGREHRRSATGHTGHVADARAVLCSTPFWMLTAAFFAGSLAATALSVHLVVYLVGRGDSPAFAATAVGIIGVMQIPGRLLFGPVFRYAPRPQATASLFVAIAAGVGLIVGAPWKAATLAGIALLGMGNGMATLARATAIADHYGPHAYGQIAGVAASATTGARAGGPILAALWAGAVGYDAMLWTLAGVAVGAAVLAFAAEQRSPVAEVP